MDQSRTLQLGSKKEVREYVKSHRPSAFPLMGLYKNLSQVLDSQKGQWGAFKALSDEPPLEGVLPPHIDWYFPIIKNKEMQFAKSQKWQRNSLGVLEPVEGTVMASDRLQGFLVPGVAFSKKGQRVGRGHGYFDRALAGSTALKVGICYSYQVFEQLPVEDHDVNMDVLISNDEIIWLKR